MVSVTVKKNPSSDRELVIKNYTDVSIGEGAIVRIIQTLENYSKVSVEINTFNLVDYDIMQFIDTTGIKYPNSGSNLLQKNSIKSNI